MAYLLRSGVSQSTGTNGGQSDRQYTTLSVSTEFRDAVRVAKAERGLSYEAYLRQHVPVNTED